MFPNVITTVTAFSRLLLGGIGLDSVTERLESATLILPGDPQKPFPLPPDDNSGIHLAIGPRCGSFPGTTADVNAGIIPERFTTIVSFGDSYTDGGKSDGSPLDPPIIIPPNPLAGGRSTNGLTWVEQVANDLNATIMDYAIAGACIDLSLWPSNPRPVDFLLEARTFLGQNNQLDPNTTLYSMFFGINDYIASFNDGDHMPEAAEQLLNQITILAAPPTNARNFMVLDVYGRGEIVQRGEDFKQKIYSTLGQFHQEGIEIEGIPEPVKLNVSYVNFANIWSGALSDPGFEAFGYVSMDSCVRCTDELGCSTINACDDPEHFFYWFPGHISKETHRIMADYVREVWKQCRI